GEARGQAAHEGAGDRQGQESLPHPRLLRLGRGNVGATVRRERPPGNQCGRTVRQPRPPGGGAHEIIASERRALASASMSRVIVLGAGHNGLVAACLLARAGLDVRVRERRDVVGGASVTERPFARAPGLGCSTGAYLLGLMPPELMAELGLELPLIRRDPHYFLPTPGRRHLLLGADEAENHRQFLASFSAADWEAHRALEAELTALRDDLAPAWLAPPLPGEEAAERHVRPGLRAAFLELAGAPVGAWLDRFGFRSDLVRAMYAVTDGLSGTAGGYDSPGTALNMLVHNMCRLPGAGGTWMLVRGGMG